MYLKLIMVFISNLLFKKDELNPNSKHFNTGKVVKVAFCIAFIWFSISYMHHSMELIEILEKTHPEVLDEIRDIHSVERSSDSDEPKEPTTEEKK